MTTTPPTTSSARSSPTSRRTTSSPRRTRGARRSPSDLKKADAIVDEGEREAAYEKINQQIAEEYLPGIPISHSPPALVTGGGVKGLVASPLTAETFDGVTVGGK